MKTTQLSEFLKLIDAQALGGGAITLAVIAASIILIKLARKRKANYADRGTSPLRSRSQTDAVDDATSENAAGADEQPEIPAGGFGFSLDSWRIKSEQIRQFKDKPTQKVTPTPKELHLLAEAQHLEESIRRRSNPDQSSEEEEESDPTAIRNRRAPPIRLPSTGSNSDETPPPANRRRRMLPNASDKTNKNQKQGGSNGSADKLSGGIKPDVLEKEFPAVFKTVEVRKAAKLLEKGLTEEERNREKEIKRQQLENIYKLMREHEDQFGNHVVADVQEQLKLYAL